MAPPIKRPRKAAKPISPDEAPLSAGFMAFKPPSDRERIQMASEHLVDTAVRCHPTVKKIRRQIEREVVRAARRGGRKQASA